MKIAIRIGFLFWLFTSLACTDSPYLGFSSAGEGLYYKRVFLGDGKAHPQKTDFVVLDLEIRTLSDSILVQNTFAQFLNETEDGANFLQSEGIQQCLQLMVKGDSLKAFLPSNQFNVDFSLSLDAVGKVPDVKMELKLLSLKSKETMEEEWKVYKEDFVAQEQDRLNVLLDSLGLEREDNHTGMYYIPFKYGRGQAPLVGDVVHVHYRGFFPNGKQFNSTYNLQKPFEFVMGDPGQVMPGFETGLAMMGAGGKATFILPSAVAYGEQGSSTGIIPPYSILIYEVELIKIVSN